MSVLNSLKRRDIKNVFVGGGTLFALGNDIPLLKECNN